MTLITSGGWVPEAEERKAVRDQVRQRFRGRIGLTPLKSMTDLDLSPEAQLGVVRDLIGKANPQGVDHIADGLAALSDALTGTGLASGGLMASVGRTTLDLERLVPQNFGQWHFMEDDDG